MHLTILSRRLSIYTTRRLVQAARLRGMKVRVLDPLQVELHLGEHAPVLFYQKRKLSPTDVVIPRIAPSIQGYGLAVVNHFVRLGVPALNGAEAIATSRDKMRALQLLSGEGVPVPRTVMAATASDLKDMVELVGGVPVLIKLLTPGERPGVMVCESLESMEAALEAVLSIGHNLLVQRYVRRKRERDLRALVVGDRAVAWVERRARPGRLLHTLARGAQLKAVRVPAALDRLAVRAAQVVGLDVAAVDLLEADSGPMVFDVNPSPGLKGLERATGQDLALPIIGRAQELVRDRAKLLRARGGAAGDPAPVHHLRPASVYKRTRRTP
ncbi:MAG: 30S ribosomal protein S6--L-glutamate ligase [Myxococcales bacterium]